MYKTFFLLLSVTLLLTGCDIGRNSRFAILKKNMELLETNLSSCTAKLDTLEANMYSMDQRLKTLEAYYDEQMSPKVSGPLAPEEIQTALKNAGFYGGTIDGKIGPNTEKAIKEFQKANNLEQDGVVGAKTRSLLIKYLKK